MRSLEIMKEIKGLIPAINNKREDMDLYQNYIYLRRIGGQELKRDTHLSPKEKIRLSNLSSMSPIHLPQNILVDCMLSLSQPVLMGHTLLSSSTLHTLIHSIICSSGSPSSPDS
jgi:hypothetical protein